MRHLRLIGGVYLEAASIVGFEARRLEIQPCRRACPSDAIKNFLSNDLLATGKVNSYVGGRSVFHVLDCTDTFPKP